MDEYNVPVPKNNKGMKVFFILDAIATFAYYGLALIICAIGILGALFFMFQLTTDELGEVASAARFGYLLLLPLAIVVYLMVLVVFSVPFAIIELPFSIISIIKFKEVKANKKIWLFVFNFIATAISVLTGISLIAFFAFMQMIANMQI